MRRLVLSLALLWAVFPACGAARKERKASVELRISLVKNRFIVKESLVATVTIRNTGPASIEVPDPADARNQQQVYRITGPAFPEGRTFTYGVSKGEPGAITLAPGAAHEAQLPIEQMAKLGEPGEYTLATRLYLDNTLVESAPVSFVLERPKVRSAALLADDGWQSSALIRALAVVEGSPRHRLYQALFREIRAHSGETQVAYLTQVGEAADPAAAALGPWTDFNRGSVFFSRFAWQGAAAVGVENSPPGAEVKLGLGPGTTAVRPALMGEPGDVDVFLLGPGEISIARLPMPGRGEAKVLWTAPVGNGVRAARAAIGPAAGGSVRAAVLVAETADGVRLILVEGPGQPRVVEMPGARLPPQSEPALRIAADGHVNASLLVAVDAGMHRIATADVTWPAARGAGDIALKMAAALATAPQAAATAYSVAEGGATPRRDWVILLADGTVVGNRFPNTPRRISGEPVRPLELLGMSQLPYLLVNDAETVLRLQALN